MLHSGARGNLLSSIQGGGQKLKKTETRDCSAPELTDAIQQELMAGGSENYYLDLGLEKWLPFVEDLSFPTVSLPLSQQDARFHGK